MRSPLQWRHNMHDGVSNHQPHDCLLNRLFRRRSKKTSQVPSLAFVRGIHRWPVKSLHKGPVTRENVSIWWRHHGNIYLRTFSLEIAQTYTTKLYLKIANQNCSHTSQETMSSFLLVIGSRGLVTCSFMATKLRCFHGYTEQECTLKDTVSF